jgi:hypothetical protein
MKRMALFALCGALLAPALHAQGGWVQLFDGTSLDGWKVNENPQTFRLEDGAIVAQGPRSHLFYVGDVNGGVFKNFELEVDVMTKPNSNGGIYFHTEFLAEGWPEKGFEVQVCNSCRDLRRSAGLYAVKDVMNDAPAKDNEWYTQRIVVNGNTVTTYVNGKKIVEWTQPADWKGVPPPPGKTEGGSPGRKLDKGTFALQGHDPGSTVYYKNIRVKVLD